MNTNSIFKKVEDFHKTKITFAKLPSGSIVTVKNDKREQAELLREEFYINEHVFEKLTRGYIKDNKVIFYKGSNFEPVSNDIEIYKMVKEFGSLAEGKQIWDGLKIGNIDDVVEPIRRIR